MNLDEAQEVVDVLDFEFGIEAEVREDYSGRGMYGNTVVAFVVGSGEEIAVGYALGMVGVAIGDIPDRIDSMGRDSVVIY
jgi:hypothetical protein